MTRAPRWTEEEFEKILEKVNLDPQELTQILPGRSAEAIKVVQNGIHSFHLGRDSSMLSEMMKNRLAESIRPVKCPVCGDDVI